MLYVFNLVIPKAFSIFAKENKVLNFFMEKPFLKKIKEYLFVKDFTVGKLGYCSHCKNDYINFYVLIFGSWFNKWFLERIEVVILAKDNLPRIAISGPKHIFWWFLKTSKNKNDFSYKRFQITENTHTFCG